MKKKNCLNNSLLLLFKFTNFVNSYIFNYFFFKQLPFFKLLNDCYNHNVYKELKIPYIKTLKSFQNKYNMFSLLIIILLLILFLFLSITLKQQLITYGKNKNKLIKLINNIN